RSDNHFLFVVIRVGGFRGCLEFAIDLIEQVLGFLRVSAQVKLVGLLRGDDLFKRLRRQALRRREVGMVVAADVVGWRIGKGCGGCQHERNGAQEQFHSALVTGDWWSGSARVSYPSMTIASARGWRAALDFQRAFAAR